jgi:hypothetical protein
LQQIFDINQLTSRGTTFQEIERKNGLPEGTYEICVRAYDFNRHTEPLSSDSPFGCTTVRLNSLEPPLLIKPFESEIISSQSPQNILFSWNIPPGSTPGTQYTLKLVEIFDKKRNANDAFLSSRALFEKNLTTNVYLYGPADPPLTPGRRYAWAVTAQSGSEGSSFRNGGRSEIREFTYEEKNATVTIPMAKVPNSPSLDPKLDVTKLITTISGKLLYDYPEDFSLTAKENGKVVADKHYSSKLQRRQGKIANSFLYDIPAYLQPTSSAKPAKKVKVTVAMVYIFRDNNNFKGTMFTPADRNWNILNSIPPNTNMYGNNEKINHQSVFQVLGSAYTNDQGEFSLAFPMKDSSRTMAVSMGAASTEFGVNSNGIMRKTCVLFIESPYYNTPLVMMDAIPGDKIVLPEIVSLVKSLELNILAKNSDKEGQMGGKDAGLENVNVELFRLDPLAPDLPDGEGQNLPASSKEALQMGDYSKIYLISKVARVVAVGKTKSNGKITLPRVVRFDPAYNAAFIAHTYSDKNTGVYNKFDGLHVIDKQVIKGIVNEETHPFLSFFPVFNTQYLYLTEEINTVMESRKPTVKGKVVELNMPLADVTVNLKRKMIKSQGGGAASKEIITTNFEFHSALTTKADGYFEFNNLEPGDYILEFIKGGYKPTIYNGNIEYAQVSNSIIPYIYTSEKGFPLKSGQLLQTNEIAMKTGGVVSACISDEDGNRVVADVQIGGGAFYKTIESGVLKGCYSFPAPAGKDRIVKVKPRASEIFFDGDFTVDVLESGVTMVPANQWVLLRRKHRLQVEVVVAGGGRAGAVADAEVRIKDRIVKTDAKGIALIEFESPGNSFILEVIPKSNYTPWKGEVVVPVSKTPKIHKVEISPGKSIVATVVDAGKKPIPGTKVYIKGISKGWDSNSENYSECVTGRDGKCTLEGIPASENSVVVYATKEGFIGDKKEVAGNQIQLQLKSNKGFEVHDIWGLPVEVETAELQSNGEYIISGSFNKLPDNKNFKGEGVRLDFKNVRLKAQINGSNTHAPVKAEIELEQKNFTLIVGERLQGTAYVADEISSVKFPKMKIVPDASGKGTLFSKVNLELSSFEGSYQMSGKIQLLEQSTDVRIFSAGDLPERKLSLRVSNSQTGGQRTAFKVHGFMSEADEKKSYLYRDSVRIFTVLHTHIKDMIPADLGIEAGHITVLPDKILPFTGGDDIQFNLEKWKVVGKKSGSGQVWKYDLNNGGLVVEEAVVNTGIISVSLKNLIIKPDRLLADKMDMGQQSGFSLGGIVPLDLVSGTQAIFGYDPNCYHDHKPHWKFSLLGKNGGVAARVKNLDGMGKNDILEFGSMNLFSDDQQQLNGPAAKKMKLFDVLHFNLNTIDVGKDFFTLVGQASLDIPNLSANGGAIVGQIVYAKNSEGKVKADIRPLFFEVEGKGQVNFKADDAVKSQVLSEGLFTSKGKLKIYETPSNTSFTVDALLRHQRNGQGYLTIIEVVENQKMPLEGKGLEIKPVKSNMKVEKGEWNNLVLETVLPESDFKNLPKNERDRSLTFVVKGGIETDPSKGKLGVTGMDSPLGNMNLYYNFLRQEIRGDFTYVPPTPIPMGIINVTSIGGAMVIGTGGLYVRATATGDISLAGIPLPVSGSANTIFGYYTKSLYPEDLKILSDFAVNKSVPTELQNGIKGFYTSVTLGSSKSLASKFNYLGFNVGFEASAAIGFEYRTFVNFTGINTFNLKTGVYGFAELSLSASATVAEVGAIGKLSLNGQLSLEASLSPELGISPKSILNTLKSMELKGCASITAKIDLEACYLVDCSKVLEVSKSLSVRFTMSKDPEFDLSLDPCGNFGQPIKALIAP